MKIVIDIPDNEIFIGWYTRNDGVNKYHNAKTLGKPNYTLLDDVISREDKVEPQESEKVNCKSTKCDNCINHNYCDFEPQESEDKE